jgi:hypothetical protein
MVDEIYINQNTKKDKLIRATSSYLDRLDLQARHIDVCNLRLQLLELLVSGAH